MVKIVEDQDGIRAWDKFRRHHHRKTFAKAVRDHRVILHQRPLTNMNEVVTAVMDWMDKVTKVEKPTRRSRRC